MEEITFKNPVAINFFALLDEAAQEFSRCGELKETTLEKILGSEPIIPSSPDSDARLEAFNDLYEYQERAKNIQKLIKNYANKKGS